MTIEIDDDDTTGIKFSFPPLGISDMACEARFLRGKLHVLDEQLRDVAVKRTRAAMAATQGRAGRRAELKALCAKEQELRRERAQLVEDQRKLEVRREEARRIIAERNASGRYF